MDFLSVPDPTLYAIPFFLLAMLIEWKVLARMHTRGGYDIPKDTAASLAMGVGSLFFVTLINAGVYALARGAYLHRITTFESAALEWTLAIVLWDFAYYWHHRFEHEIRLFWASHVAHHSSEKYNLSTALRQPWTPFLSLILFPPIAFLGVRPELILISGGINLLYQFWVHTEAIQKLPRAFEWLFNTPSHHRVHHGSNGPYLDRNYGGIFILWDRLFGTFAAEVEPVVYGLTKNITTYNPLRIATHEYKDIARDVMRSRSLAETWKRVFGRPGWEPESRPEGQADR